MKNLILAKSYFPILMILSLVFAGYAKEEAVPSSWVVTPLNIDGSCSDWGEATFHHQKGVNADCAFKNDGDNLYIVFIFKDPSYMSTIKDTGMTIWFNLEGKKKKLYGINFLKKRVPSDTIISLLEQQRGSISEEEKDKIRANPFYFLHNVKVINKKAKSLPGESSAQEAEPAVFRSTTQKNGMVLEFLIPLDREAEKSPGVGIVPGKTVKVGFEWGGLTTEMKARRVAMSQNSGGDPMSASTARDRGTGSSAIPRVSRRGKKYTFWVDVELAKIQ
jgi:hypothetical protein